jgi:hypothetical protein
LEELTLSNAWELEALVEVLTAKGVITKREVLDMLTELPRRNPVAAAPYSSLATDPHKADVLVKHILDIFNSTRGSQGASCASTRIVSSVSPRGKRHFDNHESATPLTPTMTVGCNG